MTLVKQQSKQTTPQAEMAGDLVTACLTYPSKSCHWALLLAKHQADRPPSAEVWALRKV